MRTLVVFCILLFAGAHAHAQVFWSENFETAAATGLQVSSYTSPNGPWTLATATEGARANKWYVSCEEAGHLAGGCGTDCVTSFGLGASLHIGADPAVIGDAGATYDAGGGAFNTTTDRRAQSPVINCAGRSGIILRFYYIENGQGTLDDGAVWYYNGSAWLALANPAKTTTCAAGKGVWARYEVALPASASNNPAVKVGFSWVNNNDGLGTYPSFAVDSVALISMVPTPSFTQSASTVCQDSCVTFTNTTAGAVDSFRWRVVGTALSYNTSPLAFCSTGSLPAGIYTMRLHVYKNGVSDSASSTLTIHAAPHPVITTFGHLLTVSGAYTGYQWYNGSSPISGATNSSYNAATKGSYSVVVDSGGCKGTATYSTLGISGANSTTQSFRVAQAGNAIELTASTVLNEPLAVTIYDATGRKLHTDTWHAGSRTKRVSVDALAPGMYIVRLNNSNTSVVLRWVGR